MQKLDVVLGLLILFFVPWPGKCQQKDSSNLIIKGHFKNVRPLSKVLVTIVTGSGHRKSDSVKIVSGSFVLKFRLDEPSIAWIDFRRFKTPEERDKGVRYLFTQYDSVYNHELLSTFLEPGVLTIDADSSFSTAKFMGMQSHSDWEILHRTIGPIEKKIFEENQAYWRRQQKNNDTTGLFAERQMANALQQQIADCKLQFVKTHPDSYVSVHCLWELAGGNINYDFINPLFVSLTYRMKFSKEGKDLSERLKLASKMQPGFPFTDFTATDVKGKTFQLSSLKGKYILLDFWVSWWRPCQMENPNKVLAYEKYHHHGLEIVSVSLDTVNVAWEFAIEKDHLSWYHVSDLTGKYDRVAQAYGITAVPQNILIDPNGMIIAHNLYGEDLQKKLKELFDVENKPAS
ncbi:TlpA disulfide reductase family protein [Pinibacter soli]|uniref:TlpA disulfide reductase family protein n=1 Tax=Pinibacter soli TaxID=3044211 RepID=A0ABT6RHS0_9BACT|nr:TlpA disulfide reductase family protein [Pinibacter soli]MDI3322117.1 TlpA disulfide reductase family protein [Pinibacter soli]